jgi:hypothetical protein
MTGTSTNPQDDLLYVYDGVFKDWDEVNDPNRPDYSGIASESGIKPGDMKFKDISGDGTIGSNDRVRVNRTDVPKWNMGFNAAFQYKSFDLSILFQGAFDAWTRVYHDAGTIGNWPKHVYDNRWTYDNPSDKYPRVHDRASYYWDDTNAAGHNTYWMRRTDYVRLKNMEIGYNVSPGLIRQTNFFTGMRIYINGQNLLTFTGLDRDPESTSATASSYPINKVLNVGFSLTF